LRSINEGRLGVDARLRDSLAQMAKGRAIVIDYFASRRCSAVIGDLTGDFRVAPPGRGYVERSSIEGVRVFAASRLLTVLGEADLPRASADHRSPDTTPSTSIAQNAGSTSWKGQGCCLKRLVWRRPESSRSG